MKEINTRKPNQISSQARFACLDLCDFHWTRTPAAQAEGSESAILLEIWHSGGMFQTSNAIPKDSTVTIATGNGPIGGSVRSCHRDDYGFLVEVQIAQPKNWFPRAYRPPYLLRRNRRLAA
jgi:hypothetical protein